MEGPSGGRKKRASVGPLGWTAKRKSIVKEIIERNSSRNIFDENASIDIGKAFSLPTTIRPVPPNAEAAKDDPVAMRRRAATSAAALEIVAGWSSVKMLERYVPNVVMDQIVDECLYPLRKPGKDSLSKIDFDLPQSSMCAAQGPKKDVEKACS